MTGLTRWFNDVSLADTSIVGGKNASLGEMFSNLGGLGVVVPNGFATTVDAFRLFMAESGLDIRVAERLADLDADDPPALREAGEDVRRWVAGAPLPDVLVEEVGAAYQELGSGVGGSVVAVRSSATAEDLPDASFAGLQDTYLGIQGVDRVVGAVRDVFASLYSYRAIDYRARLGYDQTGVAISVGVQRMVRSAVAGVAFTIDTESGFDGVVFITGAYGLGELLVQGGINPDEFYVAKRNLAAGRPAVISRTLGSKTQQMVFDGSEGTEVTVEDVSPGPAAALLPHRRRDRGAGAPGCHHREVLRASHGYRMGQGRRRRPALHCAGTPRDGAEPWGSGNSGAVPAEGLRPRSRDRS